MTEPIDTPTDATSVEAKITNPKITEPKIVKPKTTGAKKWLSLGVPLALMIGAGLWLVADINTGSDASTAETAEDSAPQTAARYTVMQRPEALTWLERADKKTATGKIDTALAYYDKAVAVGVDSISTIVAKKLWEAEDGIPFNPSRVETITEALNDKSKAEMLLMMGKSYLNGAPDHIDVDTKKGMTLLERAVEFGDMDAQILIDNFKTGRDISLLSDNPIVENIADIGATKVDENGGAINSGANDDASSDQTDSGGL